MLAREQHSRPGLVTDMPSNSTATASRSGPLSRRMPEKEQLSTLVNAGAQTGFHRTNVKCCRRSMQPTESKRLIDDAFLNLHTVSVPTKHWKICFFGHVIGLRLVRLSACRPKTHCGKECSAPVQPRRWSRVKDMALQRSPSSFWGLLKRWSLVVFTARWCSSSQLPETVGACGCVVVDRWLRPGAWVCGSSRRVGERGVRKAASTPKGDFVPENYSCLRWVELAIMPMIQPCNQARCHRFSGVSYMQATSLR